MTKITPYIGEKSDPVKFLIENPLELTDDEIQKFDLVLMTGEISNLQAYYNSNSYNDNKFGKITKDKPKFSELSRGIRTVLYSEERFNGGNP